MGVRKAYFVACESGTNRYVNYTNNYIEWHVYRVEPYLPCDKNLQGKKHTKYIRILYVEEFGQPNNSRVLVYAANRRKVSEVNRILWGITDAHLYTIQGHALYTDTGAHVNHMTALEAVGCEIV